jgi:membrane protease YdiL (CAAX protease family)
VSSLIFGAVHLMNYNGGNLSSVLIQVFCTTMMGMAFFALRVLSNGMFLPILCHFLIDWQTGISYGTLDRGSFLPYLAIFLPLGILSIIMIYICEKKLQKEIEQS